jgi:phage tail P2-like protein
MTHLLPPNATTGERALSEAVGRDIAVTVKEVWNADLCPAATLPWLAWAFSVDDWNTGWTDTQKRGAIKASLGVHQRKGTVGAIQTAMESLGYNLDVTEWFQQEPAGDPYTFQLTIGIDQVGIPTLGHYTQIERTANNAKNLRSHLNGIDTIANSAGFQYFAAGLVYGQTILLDAAPL